MIVLPIYKQEDDDTPAEWSLLELNGELLTPKNEADGDSMELGKVTFDADGTPVMTVASHELKGKIQPLKQTFVVMKPKSRNSKRNGDGDASITNSEHNSKRLKLNDDMHTSSEMEVDEKLGYEVAGVVTSKVLFDRYPKSIMR
jgi:hypothetical protein